MATCKGCQGTLESPEAVRGRKDPPLEPGEGAGPCYNLSLDFCPQDREPIHLWYFVTAALGQRWSVFCAETQALNSKLSPVSISSKICLSHVRAALRDSTKL